MHLTTNELEQQLEELLGSPEGESKLAALLEDVQPFDLAEVLPRLTEDRACHLLSVLDPTTAAEAIEHLEYIHQYRLLHHMDPAAAPAILDRMSSDAVADLAGAIHPKQAQQLLNLLPQDYAHTIRALMNYPENTAGGRMTIEYISARQYMTVEQVLHHIRKVGREAETIAYIYAVDPSGKLVGVVSLRDLLMEGPHSPIASFMNTTVLSVAASMDQEEVAKVVAQYDLVAIPVVDAHQRLVGIITVDDLVDVMQDEATEDIQKFGGSAPLPESYFQTSVLTLFKKRIGWILILFFAGAYTSTVLRHFEATLDQVVALTFFIPLLIGTGGNTGSQVVATLVRGLAVGEIGFRDMLNVLLREVSVGAMVGVIMGAATWLRAEMLGMGPELGPVVGTTAVLIVLWASMVSAMLPLILHRLKVDPAVVSGPLITTLVDGTGLFIYFSIAGYMLGLS